MDIIIGANPMVNRALSRRLPEAIIAPVSNLPLGTDMKVYFTGGYPFGSQAVRERPADVCSAIAAACLEAISVCHAVGVKKLVFLASACIYPPSLDPLREDSITGIVAPLNEPAAWPRLLAMKLCQFYRKQYGDNFVVAVPATAYGPGDDFTNAGHALPALMRKMHELKMNDERKLIFQGSGRVAREWIYVDDLADGLVCVMENYDDSTPINIGVGYDLPMGDLLTELGTVVGIDPQIVWNTNINAGVQRQLLDSQKIFNLGWEPRVLLREGLEKTYEWFKTSGVAGQSQCPD